MNDQKKSFRNIILDVGIGIGIGGVAVLFVIFIFKWNPTSLNVGPVEFGIPTAYSTPISKPAVQPVSSPIQSSPPTVVSVQPTSKFTCPKAPNV